MMSHNFAVPLFDNASQTRVFYHLFCRSLYLIPDRVTIRCRLICSISIVAFSRKTHTAPGVLSPIPCYIFQGPFLSISARISSSLTVLPLKTTWKTFEFWNDCYPPGPCIYLVNNLRGYSTRRVDSNLLICYGS